MRHFVSQLIPQSLKNIFWHFPQALLANCWYGFPSKKLRVIGVTGTNGKTTTTTLIGRMLEMAEKRVASSSTIATRVNGVERVNATKFTTASPWAVQRFLREAVQEKCEYVVLETSSHALDQYRVWGIHFEVAVITNITREHLDYHRTMDRYTEAKRKLFCSADIGVINADMTGPEAFCLTVKKPITYSTKKKEATIVAEDINLDFTGASFRTLTHFFELHLPGLFNVENALAMIATGQALALPIDAMQRALRETRGIPGRMELVPNDRGIDIVIDYAVTPDSFEKLYATVLPLKIPTTKIIHVFGACGDRDRGKRPVMAHIASERADVIILTNEDPYYEDPERILDELAAGLIKKRLTRDSGYEAFGDMQERYYRILDRRQAIRKALELAERGDIVLITGKGAEETMAFGAERVAWNERQVIEEELAELEA